MGLDMYLSKRTYVKNWDYMEPEQHHTVTITGPKATGIRPERVSEIVEEVAYWRKANAIHLYFVNACQDGVDDCRDAYVPREHLVELVDFCRKILDAYEREPEPKETVEESWRDLAETWLPPQPGCFFGSTDLDEYYLRDLRETVEMLAPLLEEPSGDFYYHSSW